MSELNEELKSDLDSLVSLVTEYREGKGCTDVEFHSRFEFAVNPRDLSKFSPLPRHASPSRIRVLAVDCGSRPLMKAQDVQVRLLRAAYALFDFSEYPKGSFIEWGANERIKTALAPDINYKFHDMQLETECEIAARQLDKLQEGDYVLLDGAGFFGGFRHFRKQLLDTCNSKNLRLLCISKRTEQITDSLGHDAMPSILSNSRSTGHSCWVYFPVREAEHTRHLFSDVGVVKLSPSSERIFRCDVPDYLRPLYDTEASELGKSKAKFRPVSLLSSLTALCNDARCVGYPAPLYVAHSLTEIPRPKWLWYYSMRNDWLADAGLLDYVRDLEFIGSFADELHNISPWEERRIE